MNTRILRYGRVSSTQEVARGLAASGAGKGTVVVADEQERGRGRRGRTWVSPRGGLYASVILAPDPMISLRVGVAVARALREIGVEAVLKWPNDILVGEKKIAGILIETADDYAIVGIGVNIECAPMATATCVRQETSVPVARDELLASILDNLDTVRSTEILKPYCALLSTIGRKVHVEVATPNGPTSIVGRATEIDADGHLLVEVANTCYTIVSGDCIHLRAEPSD